MSESTTHPEHGSRHYYWVCPRCHERVPRRDDYCVCGGSKAERKRAHAAVTAPAATFWVFASLLGLLTFGVLWMLLE